MNKRGYLRTLEALFAIIIFLVALFGILNMQQEKSELKPQDIELMQDTILNRIEHDSAMRLEIISVESNRAISETEPFTYNFIQEAIQGKLEAEAFVCNDIDTCDPATTLALGVEKIYADSIIIREKDEFDVYHDALFFLYLWRILE